MATEAGKPGTNWKQVTPANRKKVGPLVRHYMKQAHPFTACVRDNTKRFGPERAKKVCAVVKDMGKKSTAWHGKKGKTVSEAPDDVDFDALVEEHWDDVVAPALDAAEVTVDELADWSDLAAAAGVLETVELDEGDGESDDPLEIELDEDGDFSGVLEAAKKARMSHAKRKPGESLSAWGERLKAGDRRGEQAAKKKTRGGGDQDFEKKHPRTRGGEWTLSQGASGDDVKSVQKRIGVKTDGKFGDKTKAAIVRFQKRHGLKVDGIVGRQTMAEMKTKGAGKKVKPGPMKRGKKVREAADLSGLDGVTFKPSELVATSEELVGGAS